VSNQQPIDQPADR
jgi:hypothetical protein